jgi:hypothetical protein
MENNRSSSCHHRVYIFFPLSPTLEHGRSDRGRLFLSTLLLFLIFLLWTRSANNKTKSNKKKKAKDKTILARPIGSVSSSMHGARVCIQHVCVVLPHPLVGDHDPPIC